MAEWLRRLTRNQFPSGSVGSNPTDCGIFFPSQVARSAFVQVPGKCCLLCQLSIVGSVVECSPAMRAARVRFPDDASTFLFLDLQPDKKKIATSGNQTRAARVAGEHSTTEPTMLDEISSQHKLTYNALGGGRNKKNFAVGRIRTYAPRGKLISSQSP